MQVKTIIYKCVDAVDPRDFLGAVWDMLPTSSLFHLFRGTAKEYLGDQPGQAETEPEPGRKQGKDPLNSFQRCWQRWIAKRPYVGESSVRESYLEKHVHLLKILMKRVDGVPIARGSVAYLCRVVGGQLVIDDTRSVPFCSICPDEFRKVTIEAQNMLASISLKFSNGELSGKEARKSIKALTAVTNACTAWIEQLSRIEERGDSSE